MYNIIMLDIIVGPLSKKYCDWFYILNILAFLVVLFSIYLVIIDLLKDSPLLGRGVLFLIWNIIGYIQVRLMYNMCINSIK